MPLSAEAADRILRNFPIQVGQPLPNLNILRAAGESLWIEQNILVQFDAAPSPEGDGFDLFVVILHEDRPFDRTEFQGLNHFSRAQVDSLLGLSLDRRVTAMQAESLRNTLRDRYRRDGYAFAEIDIRTDEDDSRLTFVVDEGPLITVRDVHFRGNRAFAGELPLGIGGSGSLVRDADIQSAPSWAFIKGGPYSLEIIEEDLDRLQLFYRRNGYRDAEVFLAAVVPVGDTKRDLIFRVIEGERYRITEVLLEQESPPDRTSPFYPMEEVMAELGVKAGDYYSFDAVRADRRALVEYYGRRGHPSASGFGQVIPDAFEVLPPLEVTDLEKPEMQLIYRVREGTVKTLRDVIIRGNTYSKDSVIRRKIFQLPGQRIDMEKIRRSQQFLDQLRYYQDPTSLLGPRLQLQPVPGGDPSLLDLTVDVTEGETGRFVWGVGITTGSGVQARIEINKRNFDLFKLPSSANPVTVVSEILQNKAFHGGGQSLEMVLAPGTQISQYSLTFFEPDLFADQMDTIGLRVGLSKRLRRFDTYDLDSFGGAIGFERFFSEEFGIGVAFEPELVDIDNIDANAPTIVWDAEGKTDLRRLRLSSNLRVLDRLLRPTDGYRLFTAAELGGGPLGGDEDFYTFAVGFNFYVPIYTDLGERSHVLHFRQNFDYGSAFGDSNDLFLSERWYMGGSNLRGFEPRQAGPKQFDNPTGGEVRYTASLEYEFPLMSTRIPGRFVDTEIMRAVVFTDFGLLGLEIDDPTFREPRWSVGFGVRIELPVLGIPIALDFGWPLVYQETDDRQVVFFSLRR